MTTPQSLRRRQVFYIPGYDPFHPRRYRELYRKEGATQAAISGYDIRQSATGPFGWSVQSVQDGAEADTQIDVLVWSDIVKSSMSSTIAGTYWQMLVTAWVYISTGALWRLMGLRKGPVIAALYPVGMLILQAAVAVMAWIAVIALARGLGGSTALGVIAGGPAAFGVLRWFKSIDNRLFVYYLMHDYGFSAAHRGRTPPALRARMDEFGDRIAAALQEDVDEVLVIGHSSGAHLGVEILADLIRTGRVPADGPDLAFLTLGQVVPMVSFLPQADDLRRDLAYLSTRDELFWLDVTAPGDGCAFALCDPVAVTGVAPEGQRHPLVISAAFTQTLSPDRWEQLRWRFFRLHFQYLCAFDRVGDYDYFRITAGPQRLKHRFAGRAPSKSRITTPRSKYRSCAP